HLGCSQPGARPVVSTRMLPSSSRTAPTMIVRPHSRQRAAASNSYSFITATSVVLTPAADEVQTVRVFRAGVAREFVVLVGGLRRFPVQKRRYIDVLLAPVLVDDGPARQPRSAHQFLRLLGRFFRRLGAHVDAPLAAVGVHHAAPFGPLIPMPRSRIQARRFANFSSSFRAS